MDEKLILQKLTDIFRSVFKDNELELSPDLKPEEVEGWTSLNNTVMINEVEKSFEIKFEFQDVFQINNAGDIVRLIFEKLH